MAIDALQYPELHDESIPMLAFMNCLNKLLQAAGIKDFTMQVSELCRLVTPITQIFTLLWAAKLSVFLPCWE